MNFSSARGTYSEKFRVILRSVVTHSVANHNYRKPLYVTRHDRSKANNADGSFNPLISDYFTSTEVRIHLPNPIPNVSGEPDGERSFGRDGYSSDQVVMKGKEMTRRKKNLGPVEILWLLSLCE